jgi:hypothetical protein
VKIPAELDANGNVTTSEQTYTFIGTDYPSIEFRLVMGARALVLDLVSEKTTLPYTIEKRDVEMNTRRSFLGDVWNWINGWLNGDTDGGSYAQIQTIGGLATLEYNPRNTESTDPDIGYTTFAISNNTFANDTYIPNGRYKVLLRALKITGDLTNEDDYEAWLSPVMAFNATFALTGHTQL